MRTGAEGFLLFDVGIVWYFFELFRFTVCRYHSAELASIGASVVYNIRESKHFDMKLSARLHLSMFTGCK